MASHSTILFLISIFCNSILAAEPPGLRDAMVKWDTKQDEIRHRLYGTPIEKIDPMSYEFNYALYDLNNDNILDAIIYFTGNEDCGTGGCAMRVLKGTNTGFTYLSGTLRVFPPIQVLISSSYGWRSLAIKLREGGMGILEFNGKRYPIAPNDDSGPAPASQLRDAKTLIDQ